MTNVRILLGGCLVLAVAAPFPASAQSVVSTHSGLIYFFEGSVFLGDQPLQQKFGSFPDIGEGRQLRTEHGRAEVLLTPGVMLRIDENSAIRLISDKLSDTRVELLGGSGILESDGSEADPSDTLIFQNWQVRVPRQGVYRIDADPARIEVYKGEAEVSTADQTATAAVRQGETLPLAAVLLPQAAAPAEPDSFKKWAMSRSQAVSADNAIAAQILDDPNQIDTSGAALGAFSYFPLTGLPGISNPYGLSFWSPYQPSWSSAYFPAYRYGSIYPAWPGGVLAYPRRSLYPPRIGTGYHPGSFGAARRTFTPPPRSTLPVMPPRMGPPHGSVPHVGAHIGGRR
jgi:FecR-like protein